MMMDSSSSKQSLRTLYKKKALDFKSELSAAELSSLHEKLSQQLKGFLSKHPGLWGFFQPQGEEIPFPVDLHIEGIAKAFPRVDGLGLRFYVGDLAEDFEPGAYGILEPIPKKCYEVSLRSLTGVFIPALAYDMNGVRLGRGKGYYDRVMSHFEGLKIGYVWDLQVQTEDLPRESHDLLVDLIVTESRVIELHQKGQKWK